ncbi:MAG: hypothetical protein SP1CHLAM54_00580 [Chlamydiia bacterium]|nr:hypothetical protein [Chlamydiia bacterium]MCH9614980.1 hypothetical protein [Chlamydiia bacterium]MCH9629970.1 hypothetical protein [Chlamydiia bacterium]
MATATGKTDQIALWAEANTKANGMADTLSHLDATISDLSAKVIKASDPAELAGIRKSHNALSKLLKSSLFADVDTSILSAKLAGVKRAAKAVLGSAENSGGAATVSAPPTRSAAAARLASRKTNPLSDAIFSHVAHLAKTDPKFLMDEINRKTPEWSEAVSIYTSEYEATGMSPAEASAAALEKVKTTAKIDLQLNGQIRRETS